jgi:hypothetical protein
MPVTTPTSKMTVSTNQVAAWTVTGCRCGTTPRHWIFAAALPPNDYRDSHGRRRGPLPLGSMTGVEVVLAP